MSPAAARPRTGAVRRRMPSRAALRRRRRRTLLVALVLGAGLAAGLAGVNLLGDAVKEITLPLRHDDIIRQQAGEKDLDPALVAAVIYEESKFRDQTSPAGARGLMQITPETAAFIARRSGGVAFEQGDLATPQVNIAYGTYYLRYLIDRYGGDEELAVAAYNAGHGNLDRWIARAGGRDRFEASSDIPFPETSAYLAGVVERRKQYRDNYASELGL